VAASKQDAMQGPGSGSITLLNLAADCYYTINGTKDGQLTNLSVGTYTIIAHNEFGCQSAPQIIHIITECLDIDLNVVNLQACSDDVEFILPYSITKGYPYKYSILYNQVAKQAGFVDVHDAIPAKTGNIVLALPEKVIPNSYSASIVFDDINCDDDIVFNIEFTILYASNIITQRWNDVLAVLNSSHNGGYEFASYQWYKNGQPIPNATLSYYFAENGTLDFSAKYQVKLTSLTDGGTALTCLFTPRQFSNTELQNILVYPSETNPGSAVIIKISENATVDLYNTLGEKISTGLLHQGENSFIMPNRQGIYIMRVTQTDNFQQTFRISVK
jgi:hypothetical protein